MAGSIKETFGDPSLLGASSVAAWAHNFDWGNQYLNPTLAIGWGGTFVRKLLKKDATYSSLWRCFQLPLDCPMAFGYLATKLWYDRGLNNFVNDPISIGALAYVGVRALCKLNKIREFEFGIEFRGK